MSVVRDKIRRLPKVRGHHLGIAWFTLLVAAANVYLALGPKMGPLLALAISLDVILALVGTMAAVSAIESHYF